MNRPSWQTTWMEMAHTLAKRSPDPRLQVGCVITSTNNRRVLGLGYNGNGTKLPNEPDSMEPGQSGFVHAEINAIINAQQGLYSANVYLTHSPCLTCAKALLNAGVWSITFGQHYRDHGHLDILRREGMIVSQYMENP